MTIYQVAIFVIVVVASAITICWAVFYAAAEIEESMYELSDETRKENRK
jgi:hypothetical protein